MADGTFQSSIWSDDGWLATSGSAAPLFANSGKYLVIGSYSPYYLGICTFACFKNVTIPQGATIVSAKITFSAYNTQTITTCNTIIYGNDVDDASPPTNIAGYQALDKTTANVLWSNIEAWSSGSYYDTPDLTTIIQEIINRGSWSSGNNLMIMIEDNSSDSTARRCPRSKESGAPSLYIEWTYGGDETVTSTPFVCSLSLDQSDVICTDLKSVTAPSPPGPSWIENNRGAGPWDFNPSPRKVIYNEGSYLANKDNPVWSPVESVLLNDPISDKHFPCGYWFKDYTVNHCLDSLCTCDGVSISGNTSMYTNGAQTLSVVNPKDGCIYVWGIESGLCELYSDIGTTVVLKAAALASTVVIGLYTQGNLCDTITISVVSPGCEDVSIGYTTLSMGGGEEQTLTAENFVSGYNYTWELTGVGSIDTTTGTSIVYTSPYTNSGCDNPTITLSIEGQVCDSITIAVNVYVEPYPAYIETDTGINEECWEAPPDRYYCGRFLDRKSHECDSSLIETVQSYGVSANPYAANCEDCFTWLDNAGYTEEYIISLAIADGHPPGDIEDLRTGYMIESGCCPVELI